MMFMNRKLNMFDLIAALTAVFLLATSSFAGNSPL